MLKVNFYDTIEDTLLKFAVIIARNHDKWVLCKHRARTTYECPGGHREPGEDILSTAKRELFEETGAVDYTLKRICVYSVKSEQDQENETFGMLYYADVTRFDTLPETEIEKIELMDQLPDNWTYPEIQPKLVEKVNSYLAFHQL